MTKKEMRKIDPEKKRRKKKKKIEEEQMNQFNKFISEKNKKISGKV
jgi:hypothetical protein